MLPRKTPEGFRILLQRLRDPEPSAFEYAANSKVQYLTMDAAVRADPTAAGYVCVFDMQAVQMAHMWAWGIRLPRKLFKYMQVRHPEARAPVPGHSGFRGMPSLCVIFF